jgi:predicted small secreted protein
MNSSSQRLTLLLLAVALASLFGTSCGNTVRGAGKDVENAGEHIQKSTQ